MWPLVTEDTIFSLIGPDRKKIISLARGRTPKSPLAARPRALVGSGGGPRRPEEGARRGSLGPVRRGTCASRKQLREAAQRAHSGEAQPSGSGPAGPWSHCLSPRPGLGPAGFCFSCCCYCLRSWARARPEPRRRTGFACPANAKVRGRGPRGSCWRGRACGECSAWKVLAPERDAGTQGRARGRVSVQLELTNRSKQAVIRVADAVIGEVQGLGVRGGAASPASHRLGVGGSQERLRMGSRRVGRSWPGEEK